MDDFIRNIQINSKSLADIMEFVPYDQFCDKEFNVTFDSCKATWIDGNIQDWNEEEMNFKRSGPRTVILKKLNNSENITFEELKKVLFIFI